MIHVLNPNRGPPCTYPLLHNKIFDWIEDGEFKFGGLRSKDTLTDLDVFILRVFNFHKLYPNHDLADQVHKLDTQLRNGTIRLPWLDSKHAPALWKAMVERHA